MGGTEWNLFILVTCYLWGAQGSILGTLLFVLYVNDIPFSKDSHVRMYADDLLLFKPISCQQDLSSFQRDVNLISQWTLQNHLFLNWDKTKCMVIFRGSCNYFNFPIYVNNNQIERIHQYKYLGVWISDDLTWTKHIESICNRSRRYWATSSEHFLHTAPRTLFSIYTRLRYYPSWSMPALVTLACISESR